MKSPSSLSNFSSRSLKKHPAPPGLPEIWFQFGAALQFEGGGGLEAAAAYK